MKKSKEPDKSASEQLIAAIRAADLSLVKKLIAAGADVNEIPEEDSPLGVAVELGNEKIVDALLKAGADACSGGLSVPLVTAAHAGHTDILKTLLAAGAEIDAQEEGGFTALMSAVRRGRLDAVKLLIAAKADATIVDEDGSFALLLAKDHPSIVKLLKPLSSKEQVEQFSPKPTKKNADDIDAPGELQRTKFYLAADIGDLKLAKELLAAGANINAPDHEGKTPFMAALGNQPSNLAMLKWLAESGADIRAKDEYGRSFLSLADRYLPPDGVGEPEDQQALRELLIDIGLISEAAGAITKAAGDGDLNGVKKLLEAGTSPDATDDQERTPLFMAVSRQHPEVVDLLLKSKANPSKPIGRDDETDIQYGGRIMPCPKCGKDTMSMTCFRTCPAGHTFDVRETYKDAPDGRDLIFTWSNNWTPLMAAARLNDVKLATMLLDANAKVDAGRSDTTPLMCACSYGHVEMVKLLIARGAKVNAVCKDTNSSITDEITAVSVAGEEGNLEILELLWSAGAKSEEKDAARLALAARAGDVAKVKALLKSGTDVNAIDPFERNTALYAAAVAGQPEVVKVLLEAGASIAPAKRAMPTLLMTSSAICEGLQRRTKKQEDVPRYVETMNLLVAAGAPAGTSMWGQSALGFAKDAKCKPIIDLLESAIAAQEAAKKAAKKSEKKPKK